MNLDLSANDPCRLFLALWPDEEVTVQLSGHAKAWDWPQDCVRYAASDWHLTLQFIGSAPRSSIEDMQARLQIPFRPFCFALSVPQIWPSGLAVLETTEVAPELQALHDRLNLALQHMQGTVDLRPFRPHVTLARHAQQASSPKSTAPVIWRVRDYALVESTGLRTNRYQILCRYPAA